MLILLEGIPGSGKTNTANRLAGRLPERHFKVFDETQPDHPMPIDWSHGQRGLVSPYANSNPIHDSWHIMEDYAHTNVIMTAMFWQNSVMLRHAHGVPMSTLLFEQRVQLDCLARLNVLFVWLSVSDPRWSDEVARQRDAYFGTGWSDDADAYWQTLPFLKRNNMSRREYFLHWDSVCSELFPHITLDKVRIQEPQRDWKGSVNTIMNKIANHAMPTTPYGAPAD